MMDHVPYEVAMMRATHDGLIKGCRRGPARTHTLNHSLYTPARSSIFSTGKMGAAQWILPTTMLLSLTVESPKDSIEKLNQQIPHITEKRFNSPEEKLNGEDINELRRCIDAELGLFLEHMKPHYRAIWDKKQAISGLGQRKLLA